MKNKVLATLLAVCLFAGLAVPAFAISSQSGNDADITKTDFAAESYTVKKGETKNMAKEFRAYVSNKQLVQDPVVVWSVENDEKYAFTVDENGEVSAIEEAGVSTLIATVNVNGKDVVSKTKLVAAKATLDKATGFRFADSKITALVGPNVDALRDYTVSPSTANRNQTFDIVAYPKDAKFTTEQMKAIEDAFNLADNKKAFTITGKNAAGTDVSVAPTATAAYADNKVVVSYANGAVTQTQHTYTVAGTGAAGDVIVIDGVEAAATSAAWGNADATAFATAYNLVAGKKYTAVAATATVVLTALPGSSVEDVKTAPAASVKTGNATISSVTTLATGAATSLSSIDKAVAVKNASLEVLAFPSYSDTAKTSRSRASAAVSAKVAAPSNALNAAGTITIEVGERKTTKSLFKQGPSASNITFTMTPGQDFIDQNAEYDDYAVLTGGKDFEIIGVAVGTNKITASMTLPNGTRKDAYIVVKVIEKGTKPAEGGNTTVLSNWAPKLGVGETANIVVKADKDVTFKSLNEAVATVDKAGKITAVKEGVAKISVQEEGKDIVYLTVTVGATTTKPSDKPTDVPQTAVVALAPLF